jgi:hypothetical protein
LEEVVELTGKMTESWEQGVDILKGMERKYKDEPERMLDIGVAKALGIQFRSAYDILKFYLLREKMFRMKGEERLALLNQMVDIINEEKELDRQLLVLCEKDSRLGFHSEAEGYKYFPEKIRWRMRQLESVLVHDVPEVEGTIREGKPLFPEYTGLEPEGAIAHCMVSENIEWPGTGEDLSGRLKWQLCTFGPESGDLSWAAERDEEALYFRIKEKADKSEWPLNAISGIEIKIEPQRLYPARHFVFDVGRDSGDDNVIQYEKASDMHYIRLRIPLEKTGIASGRMNPVRVNVSVKRKNGEVIRWRPEHPLTPRLILGSDNPADLGWLVFEQKGDIGN